MKISGLFYLILIILFFSQSSFYAQVANDCEELYKKDELKGCVWIEKMPTVLNSKDTIASQLRYPEDAIKHHIEGTVYVKLLVDTTGLPLCPFVFKGGFSHECDEEAVRLAKLMRFTPAYNHHKKMVISIAISIKFKLHPEDDFNCTDALKNSDGNKGADNLPVDSLPALLTSMNYLQSRLRYPAKALINKTQGSVNVKVIIDTTGIPMCSAVVKSLPDGCDEEATRLVMLAKYLPAKRQNKKVRSLLVIPIDFNLKYLKFANPH